MERFATGRLSIYASHLRQVPLAAYMCQGVENSVQKTEPEYQNMYHSERRDYGDLLVNDCRNAWSITVVTATPFGSFLVLTKAAKYTHTRDETWLSPNNKIRYTKMVVRKSMAAPFDMIRTASSFFCALVDKMEKRKLSDIECLQFL